MNTKTSIDVDIDNLEAQLVANGREGLFEIMSTGHFSFPLGKRLVYPCILNAGDIRRICRDLNDREIAEYVVFIILLLSMNLTRRHEPGFFLTPGCSRYSVLVDAKPFAVARELLEEMRCDLIATAEGGASC